MFKFPIETVPPLCNSDEAVGATDLRLTGIRKDRRTNEGKILGGALDSRPSFC